MHEFISFNHQIFHPDQISLHAVSSAALYGRGIFTTVAIYNGQPFLWEKHRKRLNENAERLSIDISEFPENIVRESFQDLIEKNNVINARARLTFFDESSGEIWKVKNDAKTSLLITTAELSHNVESFSLNISPYPINSRSPLVNVKSCNYLENIYALRKAKDEGFDEAIRLNEKGEVVSVCLANVFWIKDEKVFTPSLKTGALCGTTREFISEHFDVFEAESALTEIEKADAVFITSAGIGIAEVKKIEKTEYKSTPVFREIKKLFDQFKEVSQD
jgi:4-amino-4-deoxychorismate lyase